MDEFNVALTCDFRGPEGGRAYPSYDLSPLEHNASVAAVLDVMHGRQPKGVVNQAVFEQEAWRAKLAAYRARFSR